MKRITGLTLGVVLLLSASPSRAADRTAAEAFMAGVPGLFNEGQYKKAEDMCRRAISADDSYGVAHFHLGACQEKQNQPRDAFKSYQLAATLAKKDKDATTANKADAAARKLGVGLIEISVLDQKLATKLLALGTEALADEQIDTARSAFSSVLAIDPTNEKAKEGFKAADTAIRKRGDPVKAKLAQATLAEMWYKIGTGKKDDATALAKTLASRFSDTEYGKEAEQLLENNFQPPKSDEFAALTKKLRESAKKPVAVKTTVSPSPTTPSPSTPSTPTPGPARVGAPSGGVDVDALERIATEDAKKMPKDKLVSTFKETFAKGKDFYSKATPGSEGNQQAVASALEQFIRCEALFMRIEAEHLADADVMNLEKQASMLRYACMKMTILAH